jgi:signal transduction histidine kinase/DNA-binding response OmpR family regulator
MWNTSLVRLHACSDLAIGMAYIAITVTLLYLVLRGKKDIPFSWMFVAFGTFILACGATHFMEVWTIWTPVYWLSGAIKALTAVASVATAFALPPLVPRILGLISAAQLSEQRRKDLVEQTKHAEEANKAKGDFLAAMSHEVRTPMNGVIGMTSLLLETPLSGEQREYAETVRHSANGLLGILNDILDFSKMAAGKMTIEPIIFDLGVAIEELGGLLAPRAAEKGLELILSYPPDVPKRVIGDPGRIRQILVNLAGNALKFTEHGHVYISVECLDQNVDVPLFRFTVEDTGIGIAEGKIDQLFERFTQADVSTTRTYGGTGLGLTISKELVELMGGKMAVTSTLGVGSKFGFVLPLPFDLNTPPIQRVSQPQRLRGLRVLVVDDVPLNLRVVSEHLASCQVETVCSSSSTEALALLRDAQEKGQPFHIAILDGLMPRMDGEMLGRIIKSDPSISEISLLMLTSAGQKSDRARLEAAGFSAYLMKPVRSADLLDAIEVLWGAIVQGTPPPEIVTRYSLAEDRANEQRRASKVETFPLSRVLVAEDNAVNQKLVKLLLEKLGCQVDVASNGAEAIEMWSKSSYDLVFMDSQMPKTDGFQAAREIRRREEGGSRHTPIVAVSANAMQGDQERYLAAGMDDFIPKPFHPSDLHQALKRWIQVPVNQAEPTAGNGPI